MKLFQVPPPPVDLVCQPEQEAIVRRDELVTRAAAITEVPKTAEENEAITACGNAIQEQVKEVEAAGLDLRRPYNAAGAAIKVVQDRFLEPLRPHLTRLGRLSSAYRLEEERKAEAERQARAAEIVRLQEQERQAAEAARLAGEKGSLVDAMNADIRATAIAGAVDAAIMAPIPEARKTKGQAFQARKLAWECTDPIALWNARPELCNAPTPKPSAIQAICTPEIPVPGLRLWWEASVNFRSK